MFAPMKENRNKAIQMNIQYPEEVELVLGIVQNADSFVDFSLTKN